PRSGTIAWAVLSARSRTRPALGPKNKTAAQVLGGAPVSLSASLGGTRIRGRLVEVLLEIEAETSANVLADFARRTLLRVALGRERRELRVDDVVRRDGARDAAVEHLAGDRVLQLVFGGEIVVVTGDARVLLNGEAFLLLLETNREAIGR